MKAQFLKIAGANSEDEFYNMYPTEEAFFQAHPEARQMANGGQPYPWSYPEYGMQGKGAGAQIPVETWFNYGGSSNGPLGYFDDGGSAWNYGQFPAFAKKGNQVQGGKIDNVVDANKNNFLSAIQNNSNKALMNEASDEAFQMTQFAQFGQQIGSRFNPNMYNQNMFEDRLNSMNDESRYTNRNTLGMAKFLTNNAINRKMKSIADQQKAQDEYYKNLETEPGFKDAQTVPGFDPIPNNMAKYGGSLKKFQGGGKTEDPVLAQIQKIQEELAAEKIKAKTDAEQAKLTSLKNTVNSAIQNYGAPIIEFGDLKKSRELALGIDQPSTIASKEVRAQEIVNAYNAYNNYAKSIGASTTPAPTTPTSAKSSTEAPAAPISSTGQVQDPTSGVWYTPLKSDDEYFNIIGLPKTPEQYAATQNYTPSVNFYEWNANKKSAEPAPVSPASKASAPKAPTAQPKPVVAKAKFASSDTVGLAAAKRAVGVKKYGGSLNKYNAGGGVKATSGNFTFYNDGSIINNTTGVWVEDADPNWKPEQKEGVPPMAYKPGMEPIKGETNSEWLLRTTGNPGVVNNTSKWDGTKWVDSTGTTTPATTTGEMSAEEKAVRDFATAKGQNPDEVWQNYQTITSSYGTMGAGTQQPYGYGVSGMVPYRYKHRGYGPIGWDRGYVPGELDLRAMEEQAARMGYDFYGKSRPTLFGGRKVVIKTHYNPSTGKVENKPTVEPVAPTEASNSGWHPPMALPESSNDTTTNAIDQQSVVPTVPSREDDIIQGLERRGFYVNYPTVESPYVPTSEPRKGFENADEEPWHPPLQRQGGALNRFLPKHQVLGETGFKFDNLDINVPIMDTFHNIKTGLTSINDFKQQRADARREKRGTNEKASWKTGPSPYAADATLTGMAAITNLARGKERRALEEKLATGKMSDNLFTSVGKNRGDYDQYGRFRPDQTTPIFDSGYDRGYAGRSSYGFDKGGSIGYSDWSQTPVNGYYGVPQGEFNPYSKWSQAPVMQSGGAMMQDGVYDLTEDQINEIIQMGGQVEFLD